MLELWVQISAKVGAGFICLIVMLMVLRLIVYMWQLYDTRSFKWCGGPHTWAVITGATDGIGLAYAKQLAQKDYNLLLISRNQQKLLKVKDDIQKDGCNRKVRVLAIDFGRRDETIYTDIENEFKELEEIHVLVNNVGITYPNERPEYLTQIPNIHDFIMNLIQVNIVACTRLTAMVLDDMQRRGRGVIINLSSFTALSPIPLLSLYSATKVYIDYMSRALHEEYRQKGLFIQSVLPYYVSTHMTTNVEPNCFMPTPDRYVRAALRTVGRDVRTAGYFFHSIWHLAHLWFGIISKAIGVDINTKLAFWSLKGHRARILRNIGPVSAQEPLLMEESA